MAIRESRYGFGFHAGSRKMLAEEDRLTPGALAPSAPCRDLKSGEVVSCQSPKTLVMILAGMSCMAFLVLVALTLLYWSVVKQRRERRNALPADSTATLPQTAAGHTGLVDSPEYDDAVLVQLPGDEKPQFFALPKPFMVDGERDAEKKTVDSAIDVKVGGEKEASEAPEAPPGADHQQPDDRPPGV